jgi:predicted transcriptional regulator
MTSSLAENEFVLIQEIAREPVRTQRDLSRSAGLSLGMTNLLIKRLTRKGLIKARQLDWNRTQYILTPKGALEKTRKILDYTRYTVRIFRQLQENVSAALAREKDARGEVWIVAKDELEGVLRESVAARAADGTRFRFAPDFASVPAGAELVLSAAQEDPPAKAPWRHVRLVDFLDADFRLS